jgi:hypothetical protein
MWLEVAVSARRGGKETLDEKGCPEPDRSAKQAVALERIDEAVKAVEMCEGRLTADGYKELRAKLGHLMDALYKVGGSLSKST